MLFKDIFLTFDTEFLMQEVCIALLEVNQLTGIY